MSKLFSNRNAIPFLVAMSLVLIPALIEAGGHGGHGGTSYSTYYPLRTYSSYYSPYAGIYNYGGSGCCGGGTSLGLYGGLSYYPRTYAALSYPGYGLGGYGYGSPLLYGGLGYGGYSPVTQVSKDYSVEQSRTYYIPGGAVTNSVSESTEFSTYRGLYGGLYGGIF